MIAVNFTTARSRFKDFCDRVTDGDETVIVTRRQRRMLSSSAQRDIANWKRPNVMLPTWGSWREGLLRCELA